MKKLILSTALASACLFGAAQAEVKMSGALEVTLGSGEHPAASNPVNDGTTIGWEANLSWDATKELDSGLTMKAGANIESGESKVMDAPYMTFTSGNTTFGFAQDTVFTIDDTTIVPTVDGNHIEDANKSLGIKFKHNANTIHDSNLVGITQKTDVGSFTIAYSPKNADSTMGNDSDPEEAAKSGSGMAIGFKGSFGVEGLDAVIVRNAKDTDSLDSKEISSTSIGAKYNFGSFTVGAQQTDYDDQAGNALGTFASGSDAKAKSLAVTFAATDQISLGIQRADLSGTGVTKDEETTAYTVGYDLGGALVSLRLTSTENLGGSSGVDGEAAEIRIKQKF
jgi:hypothetical protein